MYITVNGNGNNGGYGNGSIVANPSNPYMNIGQNIAISLSSTAYNSYASNSFYVSSNSNSSAVSANISGNILNVYGLNYGTSVVTVCAYNNGSYYNGSGYNTAVCQSPLP